MGDPILGIKLFCVCGCLFIILNIILNAMAAIRTMDNRFFMSTLEQVLTLIKFLIGVLMPVMLLWSAITWVLS